MKFTLSWLKDYLDTDATLEQIVEKLTDVGLEVEGVEDRAAVYAPFKVVKQGVFTINGPTQEVTWVALHESLTKKS